MKQYFLIASGCLLGICFMLIFQNASSKITQTQTGKNVEKPPATGESHQYFNEHEHPHDQSHTHAVMTYPDSKKHQSRDHNLTLRVEEATDLGPLGIDASIFKEATSDPALMKILALYKSPTVGSINSAPNNRVILELSGGRRFEATSIGATRSEATNGTVAFDAITLPGATVIKEVDAHKGGVTIVGSVSEIWVIDATGVSVRISPDDVHTTSPIISPNGRFVAFKAQFVAGNALHGKCLMIADRNTQQISSYAARRSDPTYDIGPVDWVENGKVLRVVDNWGETGGHMTLKQVVAPE